MRKRIAVLLAAAILFVTPAFADSFADNFNLYASEIYGIPQLRPIIENISYESDEVEILTSVEISIYGENAMSVISAACCVLRVIDNAGSQIDQYGKILHAYFMNRSSGKESRATTDNEIIIYFSELSDIFTIRLVK